MAINECDDVWMLKALEYIDFGGEIVLQFFVELRQINGFDGYVGARFLSYGGCESE